MFILGDSLVSFVSALKENPNIANFLLAKVPNKFLTIIEDILFCCQELILTTASQ